jgi:hypothetical protein
MAPALAAAQQTGDRELMISALETYAAYEVWFGSATRAALAAASADNARTKYHAIRFPIDERAWRLVRERISVVDPRVARVDELEVAAQSLEAALARARAALDTSHSVAPASDPVFS